jgi:hypothetical protein
MGQFLRRAKRHGAISRLFLKWRLSCCPGFPPVSRDSMELRRWDEAAGLAQRGGTIAPQISDAVEAAIRGGQPWSISVSTYTRTKARSAF